MKFPKGVKVFGDINFRDKNCRSEISEQKEFFGFIKELRSELFKIAIHPKNEGKRTAQQARRDREEGALNTGASDIIIPCRVPFVCEIKRVDHTHSKITKAQTNYIIDSAAMGAFSCIALGCAGAWEALLEWEGINKRINVAQLLQCATLIKQTANRDRNNEPDRILQRNNRRNKSRFKIVEKG